MKLVPYPEYKDSGVPWLGKIPAHWEVHRLKFLCRNVNEQTSEKQSGETYIALEHVESWTGRISLPNDEITFDSQVKRFQPNDVLFGKLRPYLAKVTRPQTIGVCVGEFLVLRATGNVSAAFLEQKLRSKRVIDLINSSTFGAKMPRADWTFIGNLKFAYPPEDEQTQIVRFLNWKTAQINRFIRNKRRLIELLKEQKQNIINRAVTRGLDPNVKLKPSDVEWIGYIPEHWEVRKLKHIAAMKSGDNLTSDQIAETGEFPVYGGNGLRGYFSNYNKDGKYLLVGRQGALCGNVHRVEGKFWATEHAVVTDVRPGISIDWYYYMLTVMNLNQYSESAAQPGISVEKIQNLRTALPSLEEQEAIVSHIEKETATIDYTITQAEREIELIREYRARLISDVVTGQVDVRGIEVPEVAEDELLALDEDTAESNDVIDDEGVMDETD